MQRIETKERADWRAQAERDGFTFHTIDGEPYWDESAYYAFTLREIEDDIEAPTNELHQMAIALVDEVVHSAELLAKLGIAPAYWDWIQRSWERRDPHLYGRMDFAYDGSGPAKLFELNYDTPTSLFEAGYFQWTWLEDLKRRHQFPDTADQFNRIQEALQERFAAIAAQKQVHFASFPDAPEDEATVLYLRDCAEQAGVMTEGIAIGDIGITSDGRFTDLDDRIIETLFKLYPLEDMFRDNFGASLQRDTLRLIEPPWKVVLSNKGVLPLLWERHRGHPNLLESRFAERGERVETGWVRKPLFSREGANITLALGAGHRIDTDGPYDSGLAILQAARPLTAFGGRYPLVGSWVVGDEAVGIGIREDSSLVTGNGARFLPHAILG
ncbi:MAG: glutathionylspermidine synthase family protein [Proteobacteria bacterium]|nr:glutathionylspermidine synthase family protein [Pseudomonadota bacterium]